MKSALTKFAAVVVIALMTYGNADAGWFSWGSGGSAGAGGSGGSWGGGSAWGSGGGSWGSGGGSRGIGGGSGGGSAGLVTATSWGSGGSGGGSIGGGSRGMGPIRTLFARLRARHAANHSGGSGGSGGGSAGSAGSIASSGWGSGGGSWGSGGGSGGGSAVTYTTAYTPVSAAPVSAPISYGSAGASVSTYVAPQVVETPVVHETSIVEGPIVSAPVYESAPIAADCCSGEVIQGGIIDHGAVDYGAVDNGVIIDGGGSWVPTDSGVIQESGVIDTYTPADGVQSKIKSSGLLAVQVPEEAVIFVNDYKTTSEGTDRRLLSSGLQPGKSYTYEIRAELDGQALTKFVSLEAGEQAKLKFDFPEAPRDETVLTVFVPEDAKVNLAGSDTKLEGTRRVFATKRLAEGQTWEDYTVRVSVEQDGQIVTKERTLTVRSGETYEMRFDFTDNMVAAR